MQEQCTHPEGGADDDAGDKEAAGYCAAVCPAGDEEVHSEVDGQRAEGELPILVE